MVRHIVMWRLKEEAEGHLKWDNARKVKSLLEGLKGKIPGLLRLDVGIDFSRADSSADLVLFSEFENRAALDDYQRHPEHLKVAAFIGQVRTDRFLVDYEV